MRNEKVAGYHALPGQRTAIAKRSKFNSIMHNVKSTVAWADTPAEKAAVYDLALWVLGNQIAADGFASLFSGQEVPENRRYDIQPLLPHVSDDSPELKDMDISEFPTYTGPWKHTKISSSLRSTFAHGYRDECKEDGGIYYPELNFGVTIVGRHHSSWAVYLGKCVMPMYIIPLKAYFPLVKTDGAHFCYADEYGYPKKEDVPDCRLAAMYRIAQIKWEKGYPEPSNSALLSLHQNLQAQMKDRIASLPREIAPYEELVQKLEYQRQTSEANVTVLRSQVAELQGEIEQKDRTIAELKKTTCFYPSK
ncbi:MAG: hypothetical protein IJX67_08920 [Oscillospiraceae bacterium]|nr:hypothetical protein [Oscillospiraceae bacterium]